jgi:hypothetical protein
MLILLYYAVQYLTSLEDSMSKKIQTEIVGEAKQFALFLLHVHVAIIVIVTVACLIGYGLLSYYGESSYMALLLGRLIRYEPAQLIGVLIAAIASILYAESRTGLINNS